MEYYDCSILWKIGDTLGKTIKPFGRVFPVEYEGLYLICFTCEHYGHRKDCCPSKAHDEVVMVNAAQHQTLVHNANQEGEVVPRQRDNEGDTNFGPWMLNVEGEGEGHGVVMTTEPPVEPRIQENDNQSLAYTTIAQQPSSPKTITHIKQKAKQSTHPQNRPPSPQM
ncbi:hypothetical protein SESBI_04506 [Sesbania bispinosa]|nr:hypothetical protein SESBI_04506 [Sesbania bispinosa]